MIVKPSISWLTSDGTPVFINNTNIVLKGVGNNPDIYKEPQPPLADVQTALDNLVAGVAAAADGGPSATSARNNLRLILIGQMRQLASYVQMACQGDMTKLLLSGFPVQKPVRQPIGVLPAPANLTVANGPRSGELVAKANPVFGAGAYSWRLTPATNGATPVVVQTTAASNTFPGLTPGVSYTVEVSAVGAAGPSNWSNAVSKFAI